jgi:membrane protein implicated in regulation of membrane protease activity
VAGADVFGSLDWRSVALQAVAIAATLIAIGAVAMFTQRSRKTGYQLGDEFNGDAGVVEFWDGHSGYVRVGGELWRAESKNSLSRGDAVKVARKNGMLLRVTHV